MIYFLVGKAREKILEKTKELIAEAENAEVINRGEFFELREALHFKGASDLFGGTTVAIYDGALSDDENVESVLEIAEDLGIPYKVRSTELTELYTADEVFACGTSSFVAPAKEIDARKIGNGEIGNITAKIRQRHEEILSGSNEKDDKYLVRLG